MRRPPQEARKRAGGCGGSLLRSPAGARHLETPASPRAGGREGVKRGRAPEGPYPEGPATLLTPRGGVGRSGAGLLGGKAVRTRSQSLLVAAALRPPRVPKVPAAVPQSGRAWGRGLKPRPYGWAPTRYDPCPPETTRSGQARAEARPREARGEDSRLQTTRERPRRPQRRGKASLRPLQPRGPRLLALAAPTDPRVRFPGWGSNGSGEKRSVTWR